MPITPHDLIECSKQLAKNIEETFSRASASRAYYAAYHSCKPIVTDIDEPLHSSLPKGSHDKLIKMLLDVNVTSTVACVVSARSLGNLLGQLKDLRRDADYDIEGGFTNGFAQKSILLSEAIIKKASTIDSRELSKYQKASSYK